MLESFGGAFLGLKGSRQYSLIWVHYLTPHNLTCAQIDIPPSKACYDAGRFMSAYCLDDFYKLVCGLLPGSTVPL